MKPIPKNWLIHSAELNSAETDNWAPLITSVCQKLMT